MINKPLVSIVLPTYNRLRLLRRAIDSVISQTYKNWEMLIIDDISSDGTKEAMEELQSKDSRFKYCRIETDKIPGISKYLNYGINNSKGKYIARLDDDDSWCNTQKLELQVNFLEKNPEYVLVGGGIIMVNENQDELYKYYKKEKDETIRKYALMANPFSHTSVMFKRDSAVSIGGYRNITFAEDWDLWLRLGMLGKLYNFKEYFTNYLSAGQNNSFKIQRRQTQAVLRLIKEYKDSYPNYYRGFYLNLVQYLYSFLPVFIRKRVQTFLYYLKRKYF
jgi:glycosyltransferase involved in cell wall biosynthesis